MADPGLDVETAVRALPAVSLDEVLDHASTMTRVDRKYLLPRALLPDLLDALQGGFRALEIDGRRSTSYTSRYLDTADLTSCRAHLQGRRRRWKVRVRRYQEDGLTRVEVKVRDGRGTTVKTVLEVEDGTAISADGRLDQEAVEFVTAVLDRDGFSVEVPRLRPTMEVTYRRSTLADTAEGLRLTIDSELLCELDDRHVRLDHGFLVVETKGGIRPGPADRALVAMGVRPRSLSKYASAAALLRDDLADNDVRRLHGVQLHTGRRGADQVAELEERAS
jgi:hypothetical protein